jgi:hypothetical protein
MRKGLAAFLTAFIACAASAADRPCVVIRRAPGAIAVDGDLDDAGWRDAARLRDLVYVGAYAPYRLRTDARLTYDDRNLYLGVTAFIPAADKLKLAPQKEKDTYPGAPMIEVWLDTGVVRGEPGRNAYHIGANSAGTRYDALSCGGPDAWDGKWASAGKVHADRWTVELALPFVEIGLAGPPVGKAIAADIGRYETALVSWTGGWGEPSEFGLVFFEKDDRPAPAATPATAAGPARTLYVDLKGDDAADGSKDKPFRTLQKAVSVAGPGDTVVARPGVHRGRVVVARGGVPGRPLTIQGELGAVLHGGDLATGWNPEGDGRFRLDGLPWQAMHMTWDDRFVMYTYNAPARS